MSFHGCCRAGAGVYGNPRHRPPSRPPSGHPEASAPASAPAFKESAIRSLPEKDEYHRNIATTLQQHCNNVAALGIFAEFDRTVASSYCDL
jgi:hypothetical protein